MHSDGKKWYQLLHNSEKSCNFTADNDENTKKWQFSSVQKIKDAYPKYLLSTDFDSANIDGIRKINVIEGLLV